MNANEIVRAKRAFVDLRYAAENCDRTNAGCQWRKHLLDAAALIESQAADAASYQQIKKALACAGYKDVEAVLSRYNQLATEAQDDILTAYGKLDALYRSVGSALIVAAMEDERREATQAGEVKQDGC